MAHLKSLHPLDLIGSIVNFGSDPFLVDSIDFAEDVLESIDNATSYREITDKEEFDNAKDALDLNGYNVSHIWSFVDGNEFIICLPDDWHNK